MARVVELTYYPIKGCAGTSVREAVVTPAGITHDRSFMVIDEDGGFRSQRHNPRMAVIRPEVSAGGERLTLRAPGAGVQAVGGRRGTRQLLGRVRAVEPRRALWARIAAWIWRMCA